MIACSCTLEEIWAVLKDYRANMHEVYKGFIEAYPDKKTDIDRIFINHGFFADKNEGIKNMTLVSQPGDGLNYVTTPTLILQIQSKVDTGETIGQATNYQRPERHTGALAQPFYKDRHAYPFLKVTFTFPEHPYLNYDLYQEQQDGLIYVPVPPEIYQRNHKN